LAHAGHTRLGCVLRNPTFIAGAAWNVGLTVSTQPTSLVLLPGMDGTGELFEPFTKALGGHCEVTIIRYPSSEPLNYKQLESLSRRALPESGPFVLLGESFSGPIAVALAAARPSQLRGLILCCSFVRNPRPLLSMFKWLMPALPIGLVPNAVLSYFLFGSFATDGLRSALARAISVVSPSVFRARLRAVLSVDVSKQLSEVAVPFLYLRASRDRVVPSSSSATVSRLLPNAKVVELNAPHCLLQAIPGPAADVVRRFTEELKNAL